MMAMFFVFFTRLGYVRAQNNIGLYFKNGTGCTKDITKACKWLEKAEKAKYDKLAKKALKEVRKQLAMGNSNSSGSGGGADDKLERYKSALRMALAGGKSISGEEKRILAEMRQ